MFITLVSYNHNSILQKTEQLCTTIEECWDRDPDARLSAHCVLNRLQGLQAFDNESLNSCEPNSYGSSCVLPGNNGYANGTGTVGTDVDFSEDTEHSASSSVKRPLIVDLPV